jgi:hypothetical protein
MKNSNPTYILDYVANDMFVYCFGLATSGALVRKRSMPENKSIYRYLLLV